MAVPGDAARSGRYQRVTEEKAGGATYTPGILSDFVAAQIAGALGVLPADRRLRILDPGAGAGELLLSLLDELARKGITAVDVHAFETDGTALEIARQRLAQRFPEASLHMVHGSFLDYALAEPVAPAQSSAYFDLVIANPPYVRTQILGARQAQWLASQFGLKGRVDMYHAFVAGIARVLHVGGVAGIIVSNRFMSTRSGATVRGLLRRHFRVRHVWDLGDTRLFDTAVLPAVLLLERGVPSGQASETAFTSVYSSVETGHATPVEHPVAALASRGLVDLPDGRRLRVAHGRLDAGARPQDNWRMATLAGDDWLRTVAAHTWRHFGNIGKIRVGVKTCADKVFIRNDWQEATPQACPELLRPLTTHHIARRFRAAGAEQPRFILYPHISPEPGRREAADLALYPAAAAYLERHRAVLSARRYVIEGGRQWYEIWVPHDPARWALPKLVFRDIAETPTFWIDLDGSVVNGDCYWLAAEQAADVDLLWLAVAVANSTFIEKFYDEHFPNKLYAGRRRFITQYVERFPLPDPDLPLSREIAATARRLHALEEGSEVEELALRLDRQVWQVFGVVPEKTGG